MRSVSPRACSGAMYARVPEMPRNSSLAKRAAKPKSTRRGMPSSPTMLFDGVTLQHRIKDQQRGSLTALAQRPEHVVFADPAGSFRSYRGFGRSRDAGVPFGAAAIILRLRSRARGRRFFAESFGVRLVRRN